MLEVAVIGAGSAGLVAARHLLANGLKCCIFEATSTMGGAWAASASSSSSSSSINSAPLVSSSTSHPLNNNNNNNDNNNVNNQKMWNGLHTNLSKHTCCFTDFPWSTSSELLLQNSGGSTTASTSTTSTSTSIPTFPSLVDMDNYLHSYAETFIDPLCFNYHCHVTNVVPYCIDPVDPAAAATNNNNKDKDDDDDTTTTSISSEAVVSTTTDTSTTSSSRHGYRVEWTNTETRTRHSRNFDGVVVTTGFFSKPNLPMGFDTTTTTSSSSSTTTTTSPSSSSSSATTRILHSQDYKHHTDFQDQTVAVVGSSFSAFEIAVDVSQSAKRVISIVPSIPWVVPRIVPTHDHVDNNKSNNDNDNDNTIFLPVDLAFYRRTVLAGTKPITTIMTPDMCRQRHEQLQRYFGSRQQDILGIPSDFDTPPKIAISDYYLDLVADGTIQVVHGRVTHVDERGLLHVEKTSPDDTSTAVHVLPINVDTILCCTGYLPQLQSFLDTSILQTLEYDPTDTFAPLTACWDTLHPRLPNLALVGMYRGSYMGVVDLQAQLVAKVFSGKLHLTPAQYEHELDVSRTIRRQQQQQHLRPQFPRFDYIGYMDSLAGTLVMAGEADGTDNDDDNQQQQQQRQQQQLPRANRNVGDVVTPAFYQSHDDTIIESAQNDIANEFVKGRNGSHVPAIVMSALIGSWDFHRTIVHFSTTNNNHQEQVHGTIKYSRPKLDYALYREDGLYRLSEHKSLPVFREYEYVCNGDMLEVYFVETGKRAHLFLSLKFQEQTNDGYWIATSDHLCIKDLYRGKFQIKLDGLKATEVVITYRVKGPSKDYEATTIMTPHK
ncbi:Dimethylaniline monooxygenase [Nitzschia inconspicua]|uniref:Dimethylaniline monooxygenase n=1 Tax=Nitzschia inconspicua TaxID=303405 RepID=A0A9K3PXR9_9STRA|nr:Dimethylaniline monooxygenase [Nitzschia inconspicua]